MRGHALPGPVVMADDIEVVFSPYDDSRVKLFYADRSHAHATLLFRRQKRSVTTIRSGPVASRPPPGKAPAEVTYDARQNDGHDNNGHDTGVEQLSSRITLTRSEQPTGR
jgi:hypothetical protein